MKIIKITLAFALLMSVSLNAQDLTSEKTKDDSEFSLATRAASVNGSLASPDDTFQRIFGVDPVVPCGGEYGTLSGSGDGVFYDVYRIYSPAGENLVASINSSSDSYLILYCDPFDPLNARDNVRFSDDDGGVNLNGAFSPGDNVYLEPNTTYYLVVTSFSPSTFDYTLDIGGDVVILPPPVVPLSNWAIVIGLLLIGTFIVVRYRTRLA